jgi:hypothetical protein
MRIIIGCEFSGVVRNAFAGHGHDAWSYDLLPSESTGNHIQDDILNHLDDDWDLAIFHPDCTYLCSSGLHWNKRRPGRADLTAQALAFVKKLMDAPIKRICIENPIGCISTRIRKPDQIIQPWQFGHPESKATCLWLKGLPLLIPTNALDLPACGFWENQTASRQNKLAPCPDRWKSRARTYNGIAEAMSKQWNF